jgi:hypothetical protein
MGRACRTQMEDEKRMQHSGQSPGGIFQFISRIL